MLSESNLASQKVFIIFPRDAIKIKRNFSLFEYRDIGCKNLECCMQAMIENYFPSLGDRFGV